METMAITRKKKKVDYVNNQDLYDALVKYRLKCDSAREEHNDLWADKDPLETPPLVLPRIPEYIGKCIYLIANKLANAYNFVNYTYRDEMISDGIEDCILRINSFDVKQASYRFYHNGELVQTTSKLHELIPNIQALTGVLLTKEEILEESGYAFSIDLEYEPGIRIRVGRNPFAYFTQTCWFANVRRIKKEHRQKEIKSEMILNSGALEYFQNGQHNVGDDGGQESSYLKFLIDTIDQKASGIEGDEKEVVNKFKKTTLAYKNRKIADKELKEKAEAENMRAKFDDVPEELLSIEEVPEWDSPLDDLFHDESI